MVGKPGFRLFTINESWRLVPGADALYACDGAWWGLRGGVPEFKGLKLSADADACVKFKGLHKVKVVSKCDLLLCDVPGVIGFGGNSGFQALNLAAQFGARRIVLVGFDLRLDRGLHWHGRHARGLTNPTERSITRWRRVFDAAAPQLAALGVDVVNASPVSTLTAYRRLPLNEALRENRRPCRRRNAAGHARRAEGAH